MPSMVILTLRCPLADGWFSWGPLLLMATIETKPTRVLRISVSLFSSPRKCIVVGYPSHDSFQPWCYLFETLSIIRYSHTYILEASWFADIQLNVAQNRSLVSWSVYSPILRELVPTKVGMLPNLWSWLGGHLCLLADPSKWICIS